MSDIVIDPKEVLAVGEQLADDTGKLLSYMMAIVETLNDQRDEIARLNQTNGKLETTIANLEHELVVFRKERR